MKKDDFDGMLLDRLNKRYEQLNMLWNEIESRFKKYPIPEDVSVAYKIGDVYPGEPDGPKTFYLLGYVKSKGGWRICFGIDNDLNYESEEITWTPISEAPIDVRLEAISSVEGLKRKVEEAAERSIERLEEGISQLDAVIDEI